MITLSPQRAEELIEALAESFTPEKLEHMVMTPLDAPSTARSGARDYRARIAALVSWAIADGRVADLLSISLRGNPNSARLRLLNEAAGLVRGTSTLIDGIRTALPEGGEEAWNRGLAEVRRQVCLIKTEKQAAATGFLVGPDQIMTHAVVLSDGRWAGGTVAFETATGSPQTYGVLSEPILVAEDGVVVLQLDGHAGRDATADLEVSGTRARGWITPRSGRSETNALVIVQYIEARELAVSVDADGLIGRDGPLIHYRTSTHLGSSGAPCFDEQWRLVGMHRGVDEDSAATNHGLSIESILEQLARNHCTWDLSSGIVRAPQQAHAEAPPSSLDAIVSNFELPDDGQDPADDVWDDATEGNPSEFDRWTWAEAAAVTATFDPEQLVPDGEPSADARVPVLLNSSPVRRPDGKTRWMLAEAVRVRALERLAKRGRLREVSDANRGAPGELLDVAFRAMIENTKPSRADLQNPDRLRAMLQVTGWLARTGLPLPDATLLRAALERAMLIAPFRHLTRGFFAGRDRELAILAAYVDGPSVDENGHAPSPILIHGPGGMGKSALLAHFILAHSDRDTTRPESWRPFVYLDFDRPELDARDLPGVLVAIARQVGPQVPGVQTQAADLVDRWTRRRRDSRPKAKGAVNTRQAKLSVSRSGDTMSGLESEVATLLRAVYAELPVPLVLVLDTLEEVQYSAPDAIGPLAALVVRLRDDVPSLRPVLAGRIEVEGGLTLLPLEPLPPSAAEALLSNHLPPQLAAKTELVTKMVETVGGNPLSLRLAAEVLSRETVDGVDDFAEADLWQRVGDAIVQGQLYERILGHLHEGPIRQLAIPGLILRYLTWPLIRHVLANACGIEVQDDATAQALFNDFSREVALVRQGADPSRLVVRPELRRTVLENFRRDASSAEKRQLIHAAAVQHFSALTDPESRAEEIYHRLWLDQDPAEIDQRWLTGIELALRSAVEELEGRARSYLANRVGGVDDQALALNASPPEWEAYAEKRASDLLQLGAPAAALEILRRRSDRLPASRLHLIESVVLRSLENPDLEAAEDAAVAAVSAARVSADPSEIQSALDELVQVRRLRNDTAGVLRALADLGNLGDQLGDDLILLQAEVEVLEALGADPAQERFSEPAVQVFSRLPDELVARAPELARRVAAQAGAENPAVLQRVIKLVGVGSLTRQDAAGLETVLTDWASRDSGIEPFITKAHANTNELTSATQYLFANRSLDRRLATDFSSWLEGVVKPRT